MSNPPSATEQAPQTLTLTDFLAWMTDLEENGRARTLRDMAEPLRAQGFGLAADHLERESARVLAEVKAKRRIVEEYVARHDDADLMLGPDTRRQREWSGLKLAVHHLASVYADHPDFREEWRA